jgi:hypothetical protein
MKPFEEELRGLVEEWLRKADLDLAVAARLAGDGGGFSGQHRISCPTSG